LLYGPPLLALLIVSPKVSVKAADLDAILGAINDPYPLRQADTSSPRDTLLSFIRDFSQGVEAWENDGTQAEIYRPLYRASETFDGSELSSVQRLATGAAKMALLQEILDRIELPPFDEIPGDEEVANQGIKRWTIPNTKIEIAKIEEGPNAGQFLFTKETIDHLKNYYEMAKDLPYREGAFINLYENILSSPGAWIPKHYPDQFPSWAKVFWLGQATWQWIAIFFFLISSGLLIWLIYRAGGWWDKKQGSRQAWSRIGKPLALFGTFLIASFADEAAAKMIGLFGLPLTVVSYVQIVVAVGSLAWLVLILADRLADGFAQNQDKPLDKRRVDGALMRILFRLLSIIVLAYLSIYAAELVGIPIAPLVAGLGVGGLAIALAIRPTLENIIGGLTLFADRPVRVGDFCRYGDQIGTVEQIGLRSTRIRSLERTIVTIPNAEFSQMQLDNFAARDQRLLKTMLGLRYETTPEQLRFVLAELRKMLLGHPKVTPAPARVRFVGYGAYSLDLEVFAYLRCQDQDEFLAIQEDILLRMADIIGEAGTGFAFPSQTMYYTRDGGLDAARGEQAEAQVRDWREHDRLPFPEFDPGLRWEMEDILDYPPRGAYDHQHRKGLSEEEEPERPSIPSQPPGKPEP
jgi:MscS family membrane protein